MTLFPRPSKGGTPVLALLAALFVAAPAYPQTSLNTLLGGSSSTGSGCGVDSSCIGGGASDCGPGTTGSTCGGDAGPASQPAPARLNIGAGNPINVLTGNKYQKEIDLPALPGVLGLEIVRHYNSQLSRPDAGLGLFGRGWKLSYETELYAIGNTVQILQADGTRIIFSRDPRNPSLCSTADPARGEVRIEKKPLGDEYVWTWPNGRKLFFDRAGKLTQILAPTGEFVSLQHDPQGYLIKVTDPQGRSLSLNYADRRSEGFHGVRSIDSPVGRFAYAYGSEPPKGSSLDKKTLLANLVKVTLPSHYDADQKAHPYANRGVTTSAVAREYHYEEARFPTLLTGITVTGTGSDGRPMHQRIATYGYDAAGRGVRSARGDASGKADGIEEVYLDWSRPGQTVVTNGLGRKTTYSYAIRAGEFRLLEVRGTGCASCGPSNRRYGYDRLGRLVETTEFDAAGQALAALRTELDARSRPRRIERIAYRNGKAQPGQWLVRYEYPSSQAQQPSLIARPSVVPGKEYQVRISYNAAGQPLAVTEAGFAPGLPTGGDVSTSTPISRTTAYTYQVVNGRSLLASIDGPLPNGPKGDPADSDISRFEWDASGRHVIALTQPGGIRTSVEFDHAGRPTRTIVTDAHRRVQFDTEYEGRLSTAKRLTQTMWRLDGGGAPRREPPLSLVIDAARDATDTLVGLGVDTVIYDESAIGRIRGAMLEAQARPHAATDDRASGMERDPAGRPIAWRGADGKEILRANWGATGTAAQNSILALSTASLQARRLLDDFGRVVVIQNPGQNWQTARYDEAGRLVESTDPRGARQVLAWDAAGRLQRLERFAPRHSTPEQILEYRYFGPWPSEERITDAEGKRTIYTEYDARGRVLSETLQLEPAGWLAATLRQPIRLSQTYRYDEFGRQLARTLADNEGRTLTLAQTPDQHGLPTNMFTRGALPAWLGGQRSLLERIDWQRLPSLSFATNLLHGDGSIDRFDPLAEADMAGPDNTFDTQGIAATSVAGTSRLPHHPPGRDMGGLPAALDTGRGEQRLHWNAAAQLIEIQRADGSSRFVYDARGRRVLKLVGDGQGHTQATIAFYEANRLIAEADAQGRAEYAYAYLGWRPVAQIALTTASWWERLKTYMFGAPARHLHTSRAGRVLSMTENGTLVWRDEPPAPAGLVRTAWREEKPGNMHQPLRYVGQYHDDESDLAYHGARYFEPSSGRFISPDPQGVADAVNGLPADLLLDLYAYAGGQPEDYFDPDGAARIRYFAITSNADGKPLGMTQGFTNARWAFIVDKVQTGGDSSAPGQKRNEYARNGTSLLYDVNGNFLSTGQASLTWSGGDSGIADMFREHYGSNLISIPQFTIDNMNDNDATTLIASYIQADRDQLFGSTCPQRARLLPPIRFAPGEADINVSRQVESPVTGMDGNQANVQRILNCNHPGSMPVTYTSDEERRRVVKYEAAAELQESPATSAIYKDCSKNNGCRTGTDITVNGHSYYASYGRTQFVTETFLRTLRTNVATMTAAQRTQLKLDQSVRLPDGSMGTMLDMVRIANDRATTAAIYFETYRTRFGKGLSIQKASDAWNSMKPEERTEFMRTTGLAQLEFVDMLGFVADGRARTNAEAKNAFGSEAAMRLLDRNGQRVFKDWLMWLYSSQDEYNFVSKAFLKSNLTTVLNAPALNNHFSNNAAATSDAYLQHQRQIEDELTQRVAVLHNSGSTRVALAPDLAGTLSQPRYRYIRDYVNEFDFTAMRGDWRSLRCSDELSGIPGLQLQTLKTN